MLNVIHSRSICQTRARLANVISCVCQGLFSAATNKYGLADFDVHILIKLWVLDWVIVNLLGPGSRFLYRLHEIEPHRGLVGPKLLHKCCGLGGSHEVLKPEETSAAFGGAFCSDE